MPVCRAEDGIVAGARVGLGLLRLLEIESGLWKSVLQNLFGERYSMPGAIFGLPLMAKWCKVAGAGGFVAAV